jgi:hypothetical protein
MDDLRFVYRHRISQMGAGRQVAVDTAYIPRWRPDSGVGEPAEVDVFCGMARKP